MPQGHPRRRSDALGPQLGPTRGEGKGDRGNHDNADQRAPDPISGELCGIYRMIQRQNRDGGPQHAIAVDRANPERRGSPGTGRDQQHEDADHRVCGKGRGEPTDGRAKDRADNAQYWPQHAA